MGLPRAALTGCVRNGARANWTTVYVALVGVGAVVVLVAMGSMAWPQYATLGFWQIFIGAVFFVAAGAFADHFRVRVGDRVEVSAGFIADFLAAILLGPFAGAIVSGASVVSWWVRGELLRNVFACGVFLLSGASAGLVFVGVSGAMPSEGLGLAVGGIAAGVTYQLVNYALFVPIAWLRRGLGPIAYFKETIRPFLVFQVFFVMLALGLAYAFRSTDTLGFALFFLPVLGLAYAFRIYSREAELAKRLERFSLQMAASMITALDLKDNYTARHSAQVAQYSFDISREMKLSRRECNMAHLAGLLHDLGKISVPDEVLGSRERLTEGEWEVMKNHPRASQQILADMSEFDELGQIVLHHHERCDGRGYPVGVAGADIPMLSRVVAVADSYSAMITDRPYHRRRDPQDAIAELVACRGTQFDPAATDAFLAVLEREGRAYQTAEHVDFHVEFQKVRFLRDLAHS